MRIPARSRSRFAYSYPDGSLDGRDVRVIVWTRDRSGIVRSVRTVLGLYLEGSTGTE